MENNKIVLSPGIETLALEDVLAGSPKERLALLKEDKTWLHSKLVGKKEI